MATHTIAITRKKRVDNSRSLSLLNAMYVITEVQGGIVLRKNKWDV